MSETLVDILDFPIEDPKWYRRAGRERRSPVTDFSRRSIIPALIAAAISLTPSVAEAQNPDRDAAIELRIGATHPPPCLIECGTSSPGFGPTFEAGIELGLTTSLSAYTTLSVYEIRQSDTVRPDARGISVGLRQGALDGRGPWIGAGLALQKRQFVEQFVGGETRWSGYGPGAELLVGWMIPLSERVALSPSLTYRRYRNGAPDGTTVITTTYFLTVGLHLAR